MKRSGHVQKKTHHENWYITRGASSKWTYIKCILSKFNNDSEKEHGGLLLLSNFKYFYLNKSLFCIIKSCFSRESLLWNKTRVPFFRKRCKESKKILKNKKRTEFKISKGRRFKDDLFLALWRGMKKSITLL